MDVMEELGNLSDTVMPALSASMNSPARGTSATMGMPVAFERDSTLALSPGDPRSLKMNPATRGGSEPKLSSPRRMLFAA